MCSAAAAMEKHVSSCSGPAIICRPTGKSSAKPQGTERAGRPAKDAGTVKISSKYIEIGLECAPNVNAGPGVVGDRMASTVSRAVVISKESCWRTAWALL